MFFEKAPRPTQTLSGPIPTNLDSLVGGFEAAKYTGGGGRNSRAMVEAEVWQPILDELREYGLDFNNPGDKRFEYAFFPKFGQGSLYNDADQELNDIYNALEVNKFRLPEDLYNAAQPEAIKQAELEIIETYEQDLADMAQKNPSLMAGISRFGGAVGSSVYDPYVIAPMGGPIKSLWKTMLQNAIGGAGYGAASEIDVANWFNSLNKDYTLDQFVFNVTSQAAFGAALPGVVYGIGKGFKLTSEIAGLTNAQAREGWEAVRRSNPEAIPDEDNALANVLEVHDDVDQSNPLIGVDNFDDALAKTEHELRTLEAQQAINTEQTLKIPEQPAALVNPDVLTADLPNLDGRKFRFEVDQLEVDAKVFQFKSGGDEFGVTERLLDVDEWNYDIANDIMVFETREGRLIIADGHQRLALAKRLKAKDPNLDIKLYGVVKREIDGYTPESVMLEAALKNIAEASQANRSNIIVDAAKVLKIRPDRLEGIPPRSALYNHINNLVKLDDAAFDLVEQGIVNEKYAALIGAIITDKDLHVEAVKILKRFDPKNMDEAESIIRQLNESPRDIVKEETLFGDEFNVETLFEERAKVLAQALARIRKDKSAFSVINKNASKLEVEGNKIERQANQKRVQNDAEAIAYLNAVANRKGPLSDALSAEAKTAKDTGNYKEAVDRFIEHIRRSVERGDFDRAARSDVTSSSQPPKEISTSKSEPQQALDEFDEPGSEAARAETANLKDDIFEDLEEIPGEKIPGKTNAKVIEKSFKDRQPVETVDDIYKLAQESQDFIVNIGKGIEKDLGVELKDTGLKEIETARSKVGRKGYGSAKELTDISRIGFIVTKQEQSDEIAKRFGQEVEVLDEGWYTTPAGYFDRKLLVRTPNGLVAEIQIWSPKLYDAKFEKGGDKLYTQYREIEKTNPKKAQELAQKQRSLYAKAISQEDSSFLKVAGIGKLPKFRSNSDINAFSSGITRPVLKTSGPSTAVQEPPGVSIARASVTENEIAGRPSQSTSIRSDISEPPTKDIGDPVSEVKPDQEVRYNQEKKYM